MKKTILNLLVCSAIMMVTSVTADIAAQGPECCSRRAVLKSCTINDPMGLMGSGGDVEDMIPPADTSMRIIDDPSSMTWLDPQQSFCSSIKTRLAQTLNRDCFQLQDPQSMEHNRQVAQRDGWSSLLKPSNPPMPEYSFDVEMVSGLDEYTDEGRPVRSKVTIELYFDGEQRELVHRWVALAGTTSLGLMSKVMTSLKQGPDILELLERFEKRPVDCRFTPDTEEPDAGEVIDIELSDFTDMFGEKSREFNRIVVHAYSGEIVNGEPCETGPDYKVFKVDNGTVKVKYRAPMECDEKEDRLTIYSSCEILPEVRSPLDQTTIKERIIEKTLKIKCYDATLVLRKTYEKTLRTSSSDDSYDGSCKTHSEEKHEINESAEANVTVSLKLDQSQDMPLFNQRWEYYKTMGVSLTGFNYASVENFHSSSSISGPDCAKGGHNTNENFNRSAIKYEIADKQQVTQVAVWIVVFDYESGKAVKVISSGYKIDFDEFEKVEGQSVVYSDNDPNVNSWSESKTRERTFELGPVGEKITDPTVRQSDEWLQDYLKRQGVELPPGINIPAPSNEQAVSEIPPDILVKTGDGVTNFGGSGNRTIPKQLDNGFSEEKLNYSWSMKRRQK
ncbi:MAG: hypothetical protein IH592_09635 [Bacteroidales bacterium]|nr:hypothetical protein [Bacteroidales bacterium]